MSPRPFSMLLAALSLVASARGGDLYRFDFAPAAAHAPGEVWTRVEPAQAYSDAAGHGFDAPRDADSPFRFSVKVPEGNYRVTVTLAGVDRDATVTVKAEARRLMLERVRVPRGENVTRSCVVNVRSPQIAGDASVRLNERELVGPQWDDRLSLEFLGDAAAVASVEVERVDDATTVFLAGDSTVCDQRDEPWAGWGQLLPRFLAHDVAVANYAESGRSYTSFRGDRRLEKILSVARPGDYLLMQFGHNDMKEKFEGAGARSNFAANIEQFVAAARAKGMTPILVTPMHRRRFDPAGRVEHSFGEYPDAVRDAARRLDVTLIDLNAKSASLYEALGAAGSTRAFVHYPAGTFPGQDAPLKDDTHHNGYGAYELARCVVETLRTGTLPLAHRLAADVTPFDPARPDDPSTFALPASAAASTTRPAGS